MLQEIFMAWKFGMGFFGGYYFGPGIFWVLIIAPIRSSLSVEIRSTPTPGHNAPNNGSVSSQPSRHYGRKTTLLPRIRGTFRVCRQILDKIFISSRHKFMPSRPLLISPIHRVNSSSCQVISLSRRVISSCRLYYLQVHCSYILQWFFNSSCRTLTRRSLYPFSISVYPYILKPWSCLITNCGNNKTV